jgi:hypothetical protein
VGTSTEELKRDIETTRGDLGETLDAIGDRISPGRMVERRKNRVVSSVQSVRDRVMGTAADTSHAVGDATGGAVETLKGTPETVRHQTQGNPLAAGAIAFGFGVLLASVFPATQKEKQAAEQLMDKAEPLKQELKQTGQEVAEHMKEPAREAVQSVKEAATQGVQAVSDSAKGATETTTQAARDAADTVRTEATGNREDRPPTI